jgi:WD40 repeat protein
MVTGMEFLGDSKRIAISGEGGGIDVWNLENNLLEKTIEELGPSGLADNEQLKFSADGRLLATCNQRSNKNVVLRVWNTKSWAVTKDISDSRTAECIAINFSADGRFIVRVSNLIGLGQVAEIALTSVDRWAEVWKTSINLYPTSIAVIPNGTLVFVVGTTFVAPDGVTDPIERIRQGKHVPEVVELDRKTGRVLRMAKTTALGNIVWSKDGTKITLSGPFAVETIDVASLKTLSITRLPAADDTTYLLTADGRYLLEEDTNGFGKGFSLKIWDRQRQNLLQQIKGNFYRLAYSRDGKFMSLGGRGQTEIWRLK